MLSVLVGTLTLIIALFAAFEYWRLAQIRKDFSDFKIRLKREHRVNQKALQRVIASYHVQDLDRRIELLRSAIDIDPFVFNGHNALGYAYLEKDKVHEAIDAFREAIDRHPSDKEGYFDIARVYLKTGDKALCRKYLRKAIEIDGTAQEDLGRDPALKSCLSD